jgi:hypothetical protein
MTPPPKPPTPAPSPAVAGCKVPSAINFDSRATVHDNTCRYPLYGYRLNDGRLLIDCNHR